MPEQIDDNDPKHAQAAARLRALLVADLSVPDSKKPVLPR